MKAVKGEKKEKRQAEGKKAEGERQAVSYFFKERLATHLLPEQDLYKICDTKNLCNLKFLDKVFI